MDYPKRAPLPSVSPAMAAEAKLPLLVRLQWNTLIRLMSIFTGDMVLDVQCMEGTLLKRLERKMPTAQLCGACYTPAQARHARRLLPKADIMFADAEDLPWVSESMDIAFIARGFHALENPLATLHETARVLKGGGEVLLSLLWAPWPLRMLLNRTLFAGRDRMRIRSRKEIETLMRTAGFEEIHYTRVGLIGCVVTGLKK